MKLLSLFALSILATVMLFTVSAFAQANAQPTKIALINTAAFGEIGGITKYANAKASLLKEFEPVNNELQTMGTKYESLRKEIENLRDQASKPGSTISPATYQSKIDEYDALGRQIQFKQEDAKARSVSRYNTVVGPVLQDIGKAIQDYAKQKGYDLVLDASKLDEAGYVLAIGDNKIDVTKDFIVFYNSRLASTPTSTPK